MSHFALPGVPLDAPATHFVRPSVQCELLNLKQNVFECSNSVDVFPVKLLHMVNDQFLYAYLIIVEVTVIMGAI